MTGEYMLLKIKMLLYEKKILKITTIEDKIAFIQYKNPSLYNITTDGYFLYNKNIIKDIEFIKAILSTNPNEYMHSTLDYSKDFLTLQEWVSEDGYILHKPNNAIRVWLVMVASLITTYYDYTSDLTSGKKYSNFIKLKSYIINTEYLIDSLLQISLQQK